MARQIEEATRTRMPTAETPLGRGENHPRPRAEMTTWPTSAAPRASRWPLINVTAYNATYVALAETLGSDLLTR
jgi:hypothetical protein